MNKYILILMILIVASCKNDTEAPASNALNPNQATTTTTPATPETTTEIVVDERESADKAQKMNSVSEGKKLTNAKYYDRNGNELSFDNYKGKTVILDMWATWCTPCIDAMPDFDKLARDFASNDKLAFVKISVDEDRKGWESYVKQKQHGENSIWVGRDELNPLFWLCYKNIAYEGKEMVLESLPRYVIIGPDGTVIDKEAPSPQTNDLLASINSLKL